jgi:hypothetical protein
MTANATIYAPVHILPERAHLEPLAPGATIERDVEAARIVLSWPDLRVTLSRMPDPEIGRHLHGLQEFVRSRGGGEALATRVLTTMSVYGITVEPRFDPEGRAMQFVCDLTEATDGLCLHEDGQIVDAAGRDLLGDGAPVLGPPPADRVAARALVLLAVSMRGLFDDSAGTPDEPKADALRSKLASWLERHAADELEDHERALLSAPIGQAERQAIVDAVWEAEGAQVLLFALGARALPAHDEQEHPYAVAREVGVMGDSPPALLERPRLAPAEDLLRLRHRLLAIHWRAVNQFVRPGPVDFLGVAKKGFLEGVDLSGIAVVEGDLGVRGVPFSRAAAPTQQLMRSIARERHRAANWLIGVDPIYSRVITPT